MQTSQPLPPNLTTPALQAAYRATLAFICDPVTDLVRGDINPAAHVVFVRSAHRAMTIDIATIAQVAPQIPEGAAAEIREHAARDGELAIVFQDIDGARLLTVYMRVTAAVAPSGKAA